LLLRGLASARPTAGLHGAVGTRAVPRPHRAGQGRWIGAGGVNSPGASPGEPFSFSSLIDPFRRERHETRKEDFDYFVGTKIAGRSRGNALG